MSLVKSRILGLPALLFWITAFLLGVAAFVPAIVAWFTTEELALVVAVRNNPFAIWTGADGQPGFFRPLIPLIVWAGDSLWGLEPRPYHLINVVLHLGNSLLVYLIARYWVAFLPLSHSLRQQNTAAAAGLFFLLWPSHSESVAWIPALTDVAATTGALGSLAAYLIFRNGGRRPWAVAALIMYVIALSAKEAAVSLPAAIFIYEATRALVLRTFSWKVAVVPAGYVIIMGLYFLLRKAVMGVFLGGYGEGVHDNFTWERLQWTLSPNLANAFLPLPGLTVGTKNWIMIAFFVLTFGAVMWCWRRRRESPLAIFAVAVTGVMVFLPGLNLGPGHITEGQRFAYFPSAFGATFLAMVLAYTLARWKVVLSLVWILAIAGGVLLASYNNNWYEAGKVARSLVRDMKDLPEARRTYVLTSTDSYREAFIIPHSLNSAYELLVEDQRAGEIMVASSVSGWEPGKTVHAGIMERPEGMEGNPVYGLAVPPHDNESPVQMKLEGFINPYTSQWFDVRQEGPFVFVGLKDYNPVTDQIYYMDGNKWVQVAARQ